MERIIKLNRNAEFKRAYKKGKPLVGKYIVVYVLKNHRLENRIGITASKKLGCAVERNRARRLISEAYRLNRHMYKTGYDFVIVGRTKCVRAKMQDVEECLNSLIKKNNLTIKE